MSLWEDLPVSVGANLISHWITKDELHQLDRACCSLGSREAYLSYCANATSNNQVGLHKQSSVNWYLTRKIKILSIRITEDIPITSLNLIKSIDKLLELNAARIIELTIGNKLQDSSVITKIVNLCANIESLTISHKTYKSIPNDLITLLFQGLTNLTSLTLNRCNLTQEHSNILKERKYKLSKLSLRNVNKLTLDIFLNPTLCCYYELQYLQLFGNSIEELEINKFLKYCHNLRYLGLGFFSQSILFQISENCPYLTSLIFDDDYSDYNITDDDVLTILTKCPELTVLELSCCKLLTDKSLMKISNLTQLKLTEYYDLTNQEFIKLVKHNPNLTHLDLKLCDACLSGKCILKVLNIGKKLSSVRIFIGEFYHEDDDDSKNYKDYTEDANIEDFHIGNNIMHEMLNQTLPLCYPHIKHIRIIIKTCINSVYLVSDNTT